MDDPYISTIIFNGGSIPGSLFGMYFIDKVNRKKFLFCAMIGATVMLASFSIDLIFEF